MAKRKYETLGAAFGVAAKAATPIVIGGVGAAAGAVGLRWLAARYMPTDYATRRWLPPALGVGGAFLGAAVVSMPLVNYKTKAGREKAFKATLPLVTVGAASVAAVATFGPMLWHRFRAAYPNVAAALVPGPTMTAAALLPPATTTATATATEAEIVAAAAPTYELAPRTAYALRAGGLSPSQWGKIEGRAAGLRAGTTSARRARGSVNAVNKPSNRWAG
jgi:hypothetical protein